MGLLFVGALLGSDRTLCEYQSNNLSVEILILPELEWKR